VPEPKFAQPARHNLLAPVLIAFVLLGIVIALVLRYTPHKTADLTITATSIYPAHTVFKSDSILVGSDRAQDDLYILAHLRIQDRLNLPLFLKDFTATLVTADGEVLNTSATEKQDIPAIFSAFPALEKLASTPLLRETLIGPGQSVEGMVLIHFPVTQATWNSRKSATLFVDLYHQGPLAVSIPNPGQQSVALSETNQTTSDE
jgi:hypothetical protein